MTREATGTLLSFRPGIKVIDATLRDGGLVNDFRFSDDFVRALFAADAAAGVDYMELGYKADRDMFAPEKFGAWKFCREADIERVLGANETEMKLACMADVGRCNFRRDICEKGNSMLDMYRIATYINTIPAAIEMIGYLTMTLIASFLLRLVERLLDGKGNYELVQDDALTMTAGTYRHPDKGTPFDERHLEQTRERQALEAEKRERTRQELKHGRSRGDR